MSNYIKTVGKDRYACIDNFFGSHRYGYILLNEGERWETFVITNRKTLDGKQFNKIIKEYEQRN